MIFHKPSFLTRKQVDILIRDGFATEEYIRGMNIPIIEDQPLVYIPETEHHRKIKEQIHRIVKEMK